MNDKTKALMGELRKGLEAIYAGRLRGVYLYGSYARGGEDVESDADVLIILDQIRDYAAEVDRTSFLVSTLSLKYGVSLSRVFISDESWVKQRTVFLRNAREEAIPV